MIGRLQRLPLRTVWPHEALDFTVWLEANVDALDDALGLGLTSALREQSTGTFSVDLLCETSAGAKVVVENQLERSDHRHLGQLVTYLASFGADAAVWVVAEARAEHVEAVAWLNESTAAAFYLVKVEAVQIIGEFESPPAPVFTLVVGPSEGARALGDQKRGLSEAKQRRHSFLLGLVERDPEATGPPPSDGWLRAGSAPLGGARYHYNARPDETRLELILEGDLEKARALLSRVRASAEAVEDKVGLSIDASFREGQWRQKVVARVEHGYGAEEANWSAIQDEVAERMTKLRHALGSLMART